MWIPLPNAVLHAIQLLNNAGFEAYVVGGCVRDALLGKSPTDWDITTSATPAEMAMVFTTYRTIETGIRHGTLTVLIEDTPLEITSYRIDGDYADGRHPDSVAFTRSLAEDLHRRDFTINAMAYHPAVGIVDLHNGQDDLNAGVIRCIGEPACRFSEDALRILRALRFASVLGFAIDRETGAALQHLSPTLTRVAKERIYTEWIKLLCGLDASRIVAEYADVIAVFLPEIHSLKEAALINEVNNTPHARISALFYCANIASDVAVCALRRLHADAQTINRVQALLECRSMPMKGEVDFLKLLNRLDGDLIFDHLALSQVEPIAFERVRQLICDNVCYKISMLAIKGNDVMDAGYSAGPDVGKGLQKLLDAVMNGQCSNNRDDLLKYLDKMKKPVQ